MKQLNNINTGEIIKISKIKDLTYYSVYENKHCTTYELFPIDKQTAKRDITLVPNEPMSEEDLSLYTAQLKVLEVETDYVLSDDLQNWIVSDRAARIFVKNDFLTDKMLSDAAFKVVIDKLIEKNNNPLLPKIIFKGYNTTIVYVNSIDQEDLPAVLPYIQSGDIVIENKIV